jgi:pimeloyl-ACP methyl ester carboxylesterase
MQNTCSIQSRSCFCQVSTGRMSSFDLFNLVANAVRDLSELLVLGDRASSTDLRVHESRVRRSTDKAETWARVPAHTLAARVRAILRLDARGLLRRCAMPIVHLASSRDSVVPRANAEEIAHEPQGSRRCRLSYVAGA